MNWFLLGLSFLLLHELDAMRCHEWRIFPLTRWLGERAGKLVFFWLHLPLFYYLLDPQQWQSPTFQRGFCYFMLIHAGLHGLFLLHPKNEFKGGLSWSVILGAAACGALHLTLSP